MKKISLKKILPEQKTWRYLLSTLVLTLGVYFAYPIRGIVATFPLCFFFSILGYLVFDSLKAHCATSAAIAFFYSLMTDFYDPFSFTVFVVASALFAAFTVRFFKAFPQGKKIVLSLGICAMLFLGVFGTTVICGTPMGFLKAKKEVSEYLSRTYPNQSFENVTVYYNLRERSYEAQVEYLFEGNDLVSTITFSKEIRDGFLEDFVSWMQEKRKSVFIDVLKNGTEDVVVNSSGLAEKTPDGVFRGSYGSIDSEMEPLFHFSVTFREEKPERRDFADACRLVMATINEHHFDYGSVTFYALDAGNVVYECTVTPETDPELVLSLVKYAN